MKYFFSLIFTFSFFISVAQNIDFDKDPDKNLFIRLYGNVDYNQTFEKGIRNNGNLDVHRIVTLFGYQFSRKTQFVAEIEMEHVRDVFIEQAWVKHKVHKNISVKGGLLLVPMGFINEQHEPTFFYSVERPLSDKLIIPTTWREVGLGITGLFTEQSIRYQLYVINSFLGYDDGAKFSAAKGLRSGRQKGAESIISGAPSISSQIEYFGLDNFKIGVSAFSGKTNTTIGDGSSIDIISDAQIDSTTVDLTMLATHGTYEIGQFAFRGQYAISFLGRTSAYNAFSNVNIAKRMHGAYLAVGYDLLKSSKKRLSPFVRYEHVNTHLSTNDDINSDPSLKQNIYTIGINYAPENGVVFKTDFQYNTKGDETSFYNFNAGIGVWF